MALDTGEWRRSFIELWVGVSRCHRLSLVQKCMADRVEVSVVMKVVSDDTCSLELSSKYSMEVES